MMMALALESLWDDNTDSREVKPMGVPKAFLKPILFFPVVLGLKLRAYTLSHSTSPIFCEGFFQNRVSGTFCLGWL
jgi:hypothetical protein